MKFRWPSTRFTWPGKWLWLGCYAFAVILVGVLLALFQGSFVFFILLSIPVLASAYHYERRIFLYSTAVLGVTGLVTAIFDSTRLVEMILAVLLSTGVTLATAELIFRLVQERDKLDRTLRTNREQFSSFMAQANDGFVLLDGSGQVVEWNLAMENMSGILRANASGHEIWSLMFQLTAKDGRSKNRLDELRGPVSQALKQRSTGLYEQTVEDALRTVNGADVNVQIRYFPVQAGTETWVGMTVRNITEVVKKNHELAETNERLELCRDQLAQVVEDFKAERIDKENERRRLEANLRQVENDLTVTQNAQRRTQQALRQSEEMLRGVIASSMDGIAIIDYQGNIQEWNGACEELTGLKRDKVVGKTSWDVHFDLVPENQKTPADLDQLKTWTLDVLKADGSRKSQLEYTIERADGVKRTVQYYLLRINTSRGSIGCGIMRDITENRKAEMALRENEEILRSFFKQTNNAFVLVSTHGAVVEWNSASEQLTGLARAEVIGKPYWDVQFRLIGEQFKTPAFYNYLKVETNKALQTGESALLSNPLGNALQLANGEKRSVEHSIFAIRTSLGFMLGAVLWDITGQVQAEAASKESEGKFYSIFDQSPIGIEWFNAQGELQKVNQAYLDIFGITDETELCKIKLFDAPNIPRNAGQRLFKGEVVQYETQISLDAWKQRKWISTTKKGIMNVKVVIAPYATGDGSRGYIVQTLDVSGQKHAEIVEHEQRKLTEALRDTINALNSTLELNELMDRVIENVRRVVAHDAISIMLVENGATRIIRSQGFTGPGADDHIRNWHGRIEEQPNLKQMMDTGQALIINNTKTYEGWVDFPATRWIQAHIGVPIVNKGKVLGFINLESQTPDFYNEDDAMHIQAFATQVGIAMENARLYTDLQRQADEIAALYRASAQMLQSVGDLDNLAQKIAETLTNEFAFVDCGVLLLDKSRTYLKRQARKGKFKIKPNVPPLPMDGPGITVRAARTKTMIYAPDVREEKDYVKNSLDTLSELAVPLLARGEVIGVLDLQSPNVDSFEERSRRLVSAFAEQAGLALENARLYEEVQQMAIHDELTGVFNRRGLQEFGQREMERALRYNRPLSALFLDIDHFKQFNDAHSYFVGDQVLRAIAGCLRGNIREVDLASRYGGEEFVVLLPETDLTVACQVAERLRQAIEQTKVQTNHGDLAVTVSIGVAQVHQLSPRKREGDPSIPVDHHGMDVLNSLLDLAGKALHTAKKTGRNRVEFEEG